jgi:outer membrane protein assembly factor BamB
MKKNSVWLMLGGVLLVAGAAVASDVAMYGGTPSHNMVSDETGLPTKFDVATGLNILWQAELGSQSYAGPVVADGKVYVGTNNERLYNDKLTGDRGNVMAFDIESGKLLWQSAHAKLPSGRVNDWPLQGVCSTPAIQDGVVYYTSNRAEIIAADAEGFSDGENDGPFTEETATGPLDEDIIWKLDMIGELDVFPHNLAAGSPLIVDGILFVITGQGVDEGHVNIPSPMAPSFLAIDIKTGEVVWEGAEPSPNVLHGSWSNPSYAVIGGKPQAIFPGGDGWVYSYEPKTGKLIWKFDLNPKDSRWVLGGSGTRNNIISTPVIYKDRVYLGVGQDPEHGESGGNFYAIDATMTGDVTDKATIWHVGGDDFHRTMSSASIHEGLLYIADLSGFVYCLDAETGKQHWKYDAFAAIWGSTWVADGKVYIGDEDGDIAVLKTGTTMELLHETNMGAAVYTTPFAADGVMYVVSRNKIFALKEGVAPAGAASGSR